MSASPAGPRVWAVADLCQAVADALDARFNPVSVQGEISGFARAASGHCYFTLKDSSGQIRCAMFKRAAGLLDFAVRDGDLVEVRGRLGVYAQRGDLQLIVESMRQAGAGALFEEFLRLKAKLQGEGLFDAARKRELPLMPRAIGLVTSRGAAALHDVVTALQRRVPHIPVLLAPAPVQGQGAAAQLVQALESLYALVESPEGVAAQAVVGAPSRRLAPEAILLVRGGGSIEDLRAFNDETLARVIARSPVPVVCGVGHETDFTIADFVADVRAPTPTAAAELVAAAREVWLGALELIESRLQEAATDRLDREAQRVDAAAARLGRPSGLATAQRVGLVSVARRQRLATGLLLARQQQALGQLQMRLQSGRQRGMERLHERLERSRLRLGLLDPALVLQRGYAWITDAEGRTITRAEQVGVDQRVRATLAHGAMDLRVEKPC
ncbi:MAG TPA: exodeoxyribonuclease VII large subunit [Burkholderiaceae bacterium]|nr:exodeoxyribonuclease VII large subunit [Rhodoferax sp.]HQX59213.1 exodeoxyribonuclease VII large subunit [Burkholderiaceae bacterium]HQZ06031.1 exodeoxyribonuclease VII large subunit [Burkholderiaceae bacterium]HRA63051.1 exodeoxyribonuclease VII large subunit [Burkholderiaceae bacterium]